MSVLPFITEFGLPVEPELLTAEQATPVIEEDVETPLGVDLSFDFLTGDFVLSRDADLSVTTTELQALRQWAIVALLTPASEDLIFPVEFGSEMTALIGLGLPDDEFTDEVRRTLREAMLVHERIAAVHPLEVQVGLTEDGERALVFRGAIILDDSARLILGGGFSGG